MKNRRFYFHTSTAGHSLYLVPIVQKNLKNFKILWSLTFKYTYIKNFKNQILNNCII